MSPVPGADALPLDPQREADRILLTRYVPPGVMVNSDFDIVQFRGKSTAYFEPSQGRATFQLTRMVKEGLAVPVRAALAAVRREGVALRRRVVFTDHGAPREIEIEIVPLQGEAKGAAGYYLILFHEHPLSDPAKSGSAEVPTAPDADGQMQPATGRGRGNHSAKPYAQQIDALQTELASTRRYLQSIVEEQDASNEEIRSANEEIMSSNEELQSTNEELETAKEELQSSNEELVTVNEELQHRNTEVAAVNNDLVNLVNTISFAIVMLAMDGTIRRFTAAAARLFNLIPSDVGRPFSDIKPNLDVPDLSGIIEEVTRTVTVRELEVQDHDGRWYALSVRPYKTADHKIEGAVLALVDVDALKRSVHEEKVSRDFSEAVVATVREPLLVLDSRLHVVSANRAFYDTFGLAAAQTINKPIAALGSGQWNLPKLRSLLDDVLKNGTEFKDFAVEHEFRGSGYKRLLLNARKIYGQDQRPPLILLALEDVTERRQVEQEILAISEREQRRMAQDLHDGLGQNLAGIGLMLKALTSRIDPARQPAIAADVQTILSQVNHATGLTRDLARGMHPMELKATHWRTAMHGLAANVENLFKVVCTFHCEESCQVPAAPVISADEVATHLFRIAQEAINNALKHGKPARIAVTFQHDRVTGQTRLAIADDGAGIRRTARGAAAGGMGMQIMRYRAETMHGRLSIEPGPASGTVVTVTLGDS